MTYFLPLAHGAFGSLDELILFVVIGGLAAVFAIIGFKNRSEEEANTSENAPAPPEQFSTPADDSYRLD